MTIRQDNVREFYGGVSTWLSFDEEVYRRPRLSGRRWLQHSGEVPITLRPREKVSVSSGFCGTYPPGVGDHRWHTFFPIATLFPEPGVYQLKTETRADLLWHEKKGPDILPVSVTITVRAPQGDDKAFCEHLQRDKMLASLLLWPINIPEEQHLPKLRQMILEYPKSSYTPYARFALARYYYVRKASKAEREKGVQILRELLEPERPDFPYEPYAIAALLEMDPTSREKYAPIMDREYCDAVEWLDEIRYGVKAGLPPSNLPQKSGNPPKYTITWPEYRKRVPVDRWAKPVEKK